MREHSFSEDDILKLRAMFLDGALVSDIAAELHRDQKTIRNRIANMGLTRDPETYKKKNVAIYSSSSITCGTPRVFWEMIQGVFSCPNCQKIKKKTKSCLRCKKQITPGCRITHMCPRCFNQTSKDSLSGHAFDTKGQPS